MMEPFGIVIKTLHLQQCDIGNSIHSMTLGIMEPIQIRISMIILCNIKMHHISINDKPLEMEDSLIGHKLYEMHRTQ